MGKRLYILGIIIFTVFLASCQLSKGEAMVLLEEPIAQIEIAHSISRGEINRELLLSINEKEAVSTFVKVITTSHLDNSVKALSKPDYDVYVVYEGQLPTHALQLWIGEEGEVSYVSYAMSDGIYVTEPSMTKKLKGLISY